MTVWSGKWIVPVRKRTQQETYRKQQKKENFTKLYKYLHLNLWVKTAWIWSCCSEVFLSCFSCCSEVSVPLPSDSATTVCGAGFPENLLAALTVLLTLSAGSDNLRAISGTNIGWLKLPSINCWSKFGLFCCSRAWAFWSSDVSTDKILSKAWR